LLRPPSKYVLVATWLAFAITALTLYFFRSDELQGELREVFSYSLGFASVVYLMVGALRAFTLIPSTYLIVAGLPFFPPALLFVLSVGGIVISSAVIYLFSESFHLRDLLEKKDHAARVARLRALLEKHELPIIIGWSFFPFAPTDLICYVCGVMEVNFYKFLLGILVGEGTICAIYVFLGDSAMRFFELRP
jgi:uncharacterized membrane protein YdjX (TVP38/TMEM64 family)